MDAATSSPIKLHYYVTVALALLIFAVVGVYSMRMAHDTTGYDYEQAKIRYAKLAAMRETDQKTLTTADWVDKGNGVVRIPVDEAMAQEVPLLQAKPVTMGVAIPGAIPPPAAAPAPAPAKAAAPAAAAPDDNAKPTK
jgi:hypothetical protein